MSDPSQEPLSTGELIKRILQLQERGRQDAGRIGELEEQRRHDAGRIGELEADSVSDRFDLAALREQADIDQQLIAELEAQAVLDRTEIANLKIALATARRIGAAQGIIMFAYKVSEEQAFATLRIASQAANRKLRDIADDVLMTGVVPSD